MKFLVDSEDCVLRHVVTRVVQVVLSLCYTGQRNCTLLACNTDAHKLLWANSV